MSKGVGSGGREKLEFIVWLARLSCSAVTVPCAKTLFSIKFLCACSNGQFATVHSLGVMCFCVLVVMCYYNIHSLGVTCFCVPVVMANCYYNVLSKRHKLSTLHRQWLFSTLYKHLLKNILLTITDDTFVTQVIIYSVVVRSA